eukprot:gene56017-50949_t
MWLLIANCSRGRVVAFEPAPRTFRELRRRASEHAA